MSSKTKAKKGKAVKSAKPKVAPKKMATPKIVKPKTENPVKEKSPKGETKLDKVVALLSRPQGATVQELMDATEWQQHTVRSALSHTLGKKRGYKIVSAKEEGKARVYKIEDEPKKTDK